MIAGLLCGFGCLCLLLLLLCLSFSSLPCCCFLVRFVIILWFAVWFRLLAFPVVIVIVVLIAAAAIVLTITVIDIVIVILVGAIEALIVVTYALEACPRIGGGARRHRGGLKHVARARTMVGK